MCTSTTALLNTHTIVPHMTTITAPKQIQHFRVGSLGSGTLNVCMQLRRWWWRHFHPWLLRFSLYKCSCLLYYHHHHRLPFLLLFCLCCASGSSPQILSALALRRANVKARHAPSCADRRVLGNRWGCEGGHSLCEVTCREHCKINVLAVRQTFEWLLAVCF